jgi:AraC-like DNA-binding protein/DNA-binding response OmpR family regulator
MHDQRSISGIGLGLSITRHLVALHGGSMVLDSQPGKGSTFHVYLPLPVLGQEDQEAPENPQPVLLLISTASQPAPEILELCQRQGLEIRLLRRSDDLEAVLADVQPRTLAWDLAGASPADWALVRRLRHYPNLVRVPFILYGQHLQGQDKEPALTVGLTSFVAKPSGGQTLLEAIIAICPVQASGPILIVDDDAQVRDAHRELVESWLPDYLIRTAEDGETALQIMAEEVPALVLLDLVMPGVGGADVLDRMRADPRLRQVPVVILSNKVLSLDDVKRLEHHARVTFQSKGLWSDAETAAALHRVLFGADELPPHTSALVKRAVAYLHQNFTHSLARWEIAEAVGVSEDYLSRVFGRELGLSPWDYLNRYRVLQAKTLLHHTQDSIGAVARQVGFKDPAYFSRVFRKQTGLPPQAFRDTPKP